MPTEEYFFHGVRLISELPLGVPLKKKTGEETELRIRLKSHREHWDLRQPAWISHELNPGGLPFWSIYLLDSNRYVAHIEAVGYFLISKHEIVCDITTPQAHPAPFLLGKIFSLWLEQQNYMVLHGGALNIQNHLIGFTGPSGMGKSTLSTAFSQSGAEILTDDLIPIAYDHEWIDPGIPITRMWPDTASYFLKDHQDLAKVHPDYEKLKAPDELKGRKRFAEKALKLHAVLLLNRNMNVHQIIEITKLKSASAAAALLGAAYHSPAYEALGLVGERLSRAASLCEQIDIYLLTYPTGFEHVSDIQEKVYAKLCKHSETSHADH